MSELDIAASMGLQNLQYEPQRLLNEAERLNAELESLVMDNYRIFVENLTCSVHLRSEDKKLTECAGELNDKLRGLQQQCAAFRDRVNHFVNSHKRNRKTLQHHMQLVELLEVPQLVDACARNGFHEEALELANFVNGLERRHLLAAEVRSVDGKAPGGSGVVQSIVDDVHSTLLTLRQQLLHLLTEQASLPKELQILATLRKLDGLLIDRQLALERHENEVLARMNDKQREQLRQHLLQCSETRLQMDFLEARSVWLERVAERALHGLGGDSMGILPITDGAEEKIGISSGGSGSLGPYGQALEMLEVNRTTWFSVVTQFEALFEQNTDMELCSHPPSAILGAWATRQVHQLLNNLQHLLPSIEDGASLRAVLEQTCFFANRMGQVGCDLSSLAMPLFRQTLISRLTGDWNTACAHFKSMLATERFVVEIDDVAREQVIPLYLKQDAISSEDIMGSSPSIPRRQNDDVPAPSAIMAYPPLAYFLNSILSGLNFLRECPMLSAKEALLAELANVLLDSSTFFVGLSSDLRVRGGKYLPQSGTVRANSTTDKTAAAVLIPMDKQYALVIAQDLVPHVLVCFEHIFMCVPPSTTSTITSSSSSSIEKGSKGRGKAVLLHVDNLSVAKSAMGLSSHAALTACWTLFRKADLLPAERPLSLPLRQPTQTANTASTVETLRTPESRSSPAVSEDVPVDPIVPVAETVVVVDSGVGIEDNGRAGSNTAGDDEGEGRVESREVQHPESLSSSSHTGDERNRGEGRERSHDD